MLKGTDYYLVEPIFKKVSKTEFNNFLNEYSRKLNVDVCGISDPPLISYNDFKLADRWPYSIVAQTLVYDDNPGDYFYEPEESRDYYIAVNYEEVFNSRTEINTSKYKNKENSNQSNIFDKYNIKGIIGISFFNSETKEKLFTLALIDKGYGKEQL